MRKPDRIDGLVKEIIREQGSHYFKKDPLSRKILVKLQPVPKMKGIKLEEILLNVVKAKMTTLLQATDASGLRFYECYADGEGGGRRWQRFTGMTLGDLRVCIAAREAQIHGNQQIVGVYRALVKDLEKLEKAGKPAHVGDVYEKAQEYFAASS